VNGSRRSRGFEVVAFPTAAPLPPPLCLHSLAGFLGSKLMEDVGCSADLVAEVDCGKIQITAKMG
jgi:hypothetical protein